MNVYSIRSRATAFLIIAREQYRERGMLWVLSGLFARVGIEVLWLVTLPLAIIGHLLGVRCLRIHTEHVGHLAAEPDTLLKEVRLGRLPVRHWILLAHPQRIANAHLLQYWGQHLTVVSDSRLRVMLDIMSRHFLMSQDISHYIAGYFGAQDIYPVNALWADRPPILSLSRDDDSWGCEMLDALGVSRERWFVAVHVREGGYLPRNEIIQWHRNGSIQNTFLAMQEIVRRGGVCIRVGDPTMTPLPAMPGVIDYAHHEVKSDRMDVFLCARARFFLGGTSGLSLLASVFGTPVAHANMIPLGTLGVRHSDLSIPKMLWSTKSGRLLTFREILGSEISGYFFSQQYVDAGIEVRENVPEDIEALVVEMLDRLDGSYRSISGSAELHERYMALFGPAHYSYGATSRVSEAFLRKYSSLL